MEGHAGLGGIDERGHVVLLETQYEGAEELMLQSSLFWFTASSGMVLNLLSNNETAEIENVHEELEGIVGASQLEAHKSTSDEMERVTSSDGR